MAGAVLVAGLGLFFGFSPSGRGLAHASYDFAYLFRPPTRVDGAVLVLMDDGSFDDPQLHQDRAREWDRNLHGELISRLVARGARAVAFDVLFAAAGTNDGPFLEAVRAATHAHVPVVVAATLHSGSGGGVAKPFPALAREAAWGFAEQGVEDIVLRWHFRHPDAPSLAWRTAQLTIPNLGDGPPEAAARRWINYYGPPRKAIRSFSCRDVLHDAIPANAFSNQVVFVGSSVEVGYALGRVADTWPVPYTRWGRGKAPGVEINATVYLNLLRRDWLRRIPEWAEFLLLVALGVLLGAGLTRFRPIPAVGLAVLVALAVAAAGCGLVWGAFYWFSWMVPVVVQAPMAAVWSVLRHTLRLGEEKQLLEEKIAMLEPALELAHARPRGDLETRAAPPRLVPATPGGAAPVIAGLTGSLPGSPMVPDQALLRCVGKGAYGEIWVARNAVGLLHAVKVVYRVAFGSDEPFDREFRGVQKFMPVSRLHPGLVQILQVGRQDAAGYFYYVMEPADDESTGAEFAAESYVPKTLAREIERRRKLPAGECLQLGLTLTSALEFLHERQLIHRDIKPANIIYVRGAPKLADIGLVTDTAATGTDPTYLGTKGYIPPEGPGRPTADLYSLGRVLYQAAMGLEVADFPRLPESLLGRPDRDLALRLNEIILKLCEDDVARRYTSAAEIHHDLEQLQQS